MTLLARGAGLRRMATAGLAKSAELEARENQTAAAIDQAKQAQEMNTLGTGAGFGAMYGMQKAGAAKAASAVTQEAAKEEEAEEMQTDRALAHAAGMIPPKRLKYDKDAKIVYTETRKADITVFEPLIAEEHKKKARYFIPPDDVPVVVLDPKETNKILGWEAKVDFKSTIKKQLDWYDKFGVSDIYSHLKEKSGN